MAQVEAHDQFAN